MKRIFLYTIPVLMGYLPLGIAYGILAVESGVPFTAAIFMSIIVFAGSGQFLAVSLLSAHAGYFEIAVSSFLLNLRHFFYGITIMDELKHFGLRKYYIIFGLTDETFALLKTWRGNGKNKESVYFKIALLDHLYWITGSIIGATMASTITFNSTGIEFALTILFVVLTIELLRQQKNYKTFFIAIVIGILSLIFIPPSKMLLTSLTAGIIVLFFMRGIINE